MATSIRSGAIYGIGVYGVARYGVSNIAIIPDGVQASASTDSGLIITGDAQHTVVSIVGLGLVGSIGPDQVIGEANVPVVGVVATGTVGDNLTFKLDYKAVVAGVQSTGEVSVPTVVAEANVDVSSESGVGEVGTTTQTGDSNYQVTGVQATAELGTPTQKTVNRVPVTGLEATGSVGTLTIVAKAVTDITGISSTGIVGTVVVAAASVYEVTGVFGIGYTNVVDTFENARPTFVGVSATGVAGSVTVTAEQFDYQAVREQYDRSRTVYIARGTTAKDRTVVIPFSNRTVIVEGKSNSADRILLAA